MVYKHLEGLAEPPSCEPRGNLEPPPMEPPDLTPPPRQLPPNLHRLIFGS